jgi:hypothetical protein
MEAMMAKKKTTPAQLESIKHRDRRKNIPTEELRGQSVHGLRRAGY